MSVSTAWFLVIAFAIIALVYFSHEGGGRSEITYSFFHDQLVKDNIAEAEFSQQQLLGKFKKAPRRPKRPMGRRPSPPPRNPTPELLHQEFRTTLPPSDVTINDLRKEMEAKHVVISAHASYENSVLVHVHAVWAAAVGDHWLVVVRDAADPRSVPGRRHPLRLQQEPRQAL